MIKKILVTIYAIGFIFASAFMDYQMDNKQNISASAGEVAENAAPTIQPRVSSGIDLSKYPTANLFSSQSAIPYDNCTYKNGVVKQISADSADYYTWKIQLYKDSTFLTESAVLFSQTGTIPALTIEKPSEANRLFLGLNGRERNTLMMIDVSNFPNGKYTATWNVLNITQGSVSWDNIMLNSGEVAYPYIPNLDDVYNDGYNKGESAGHEAGYQEGYEDANNELSNILVALGNDKYSSPHGSVANYKATSDSLSFDTISNSSETGTFSDPSVALKLDTFVTKDTVYNISYSSLRGLCYLDFVYSDVYFIILELPASSSPVSIDFTLPYNFTGDFSVNTLYLRGASSVSGGGPAVLSGMTLSVKYDSEQAYQQGYEQGEEAGYQSGHTAGYDSGYDVGYSDGIATAGNSSFLSLITAVVDAPITAFTSLLNFEVLGVNLKKLVLSILTAALVIACVRFFSGKFSGS